MADHVLGFKHAAGVDFHHGLDAVADDPLPPDAAVSVPGAELGVGVVSKESGKAEEKNTAQGAVADDPLPPDAAVSVPGAELGVGVVSKESGKAEEKNTAQGAKEVETAELEGAASLPGAGIRASHVHSLGGGSKMDADLSDKSDAEREEDDGESEKEREDGDDAERDEDDAYVRVAARWAIAGMVGLGAALVAYAAVRARYQPFHGGALQRDCLIVDDATTAAIPDAHPYCLLDGSNAPMESVSLPFKKLESANPEPQSEIGFGEPHPQEDKWAWVMNDKPAEIEITPKSQDSPSNAEVYGNDGMSWEKFIPRGGTATAVASTPVEDLSYRRITMAALLVAAVILFLGLVIPILMYL